MRATTGFFVRFQRRLQREERGFTLIELMVAIVIIFGSLTAIAYTATVGFGYQSIARERQAGTAVAEKVMEQARGMAYSRIQSGLLTSDVAADPNAVTGCGGDPAGTYRFLSCSGDKIINSTGLSSGKPLVPNTGTYSSGYPTTYTWRTYITNSDTTTQPYKLTVLVTWSTPHQAASSSKMQVQTYFWSPTGCVSSTTHPFAAPCQPFFFGNGFVPKYNVTVTGTIAGLDNFETGSLLGPAYEADAQAEQVAQVQSAATSSAVTITAGSTSTGGGQAATANVDGDPSGSSPTYLQSTLSGAAGSVSATEDSTALTFANAAGDNGTVTSVIAAASAGAPACPSTGTAETDLQPCGHVLGRQGGTNTVVLHPHSITPDLGDATFASIGAPASNTSAFANRVLVSGQDGRLDETVTRYLGTVSIGGLPANVAGPAGWTGYLMTLSGYQDTATAGSGTSSVAPSASVVTGTLSYWNGSGYTSMNAATIGTVGAIPFANVNRSVVVSGHNVTVTISGSATRGGTSTASVISSGTTRTSSEARSGAPINATLTYTIVVDGETKVNVTITVDLGQISSETRYQAAPTAG